MNYQDDNQELEIDLLEFFWHICLRWKPILAVALAAGLLIGALQLVRSNNKEDAAPERISEMTDKELKEKREELEEPLTDKEIEAVEKGADRAELIKKRLEDYEDYVEDSFIPELDPYNLSTAYVYFHISVPSSKDCDISIINTMYTSEAQSVDFTQKLGDKLDLNTKYCYVQELFSVYTAAGQQFLMPSADKDNTSLLVAGMKLPKGLDGQKVIDVVTDMIMDIEIDDKNYKDAYRIYPFYSYQETRVNRDIEASQVSIEQTMDSYNATYNAIDDLFTPDQLALYNFTIGEEAEEPEEEENTGVLTMVKSFIKYFVVGMFVGAFCFVGYLFAVVFFRPRVGRLLGTGTLQVRNFGVLPVSGSKTKWSDFIISPFVKKLRDRKKGSDSVQIHDAALEMAFWMDNMGSDGSTLTVLVMNEPSEARKKVISELCAGLNDAGVSVDNTFVEGDDIEGTLRLVSGLREKDAVVMVVPEADGTLLKDYSRLVRLLKEGEIKILGSVIV